MLGYKIYHWGKKLSRTLREPGLKSRNMPSSQIRPPTSELLELHVFYVPEEVWNYKLNTVSVDDINKFFSAGFIRVSPHMTLRTLREQLGDYLGEDAVVDKYIFLKCIGKKLAVVKAKQETELKLKSFAPPYAFNPELYLLPGAESVYSSSLSTPERFHNNTDNLLDYTSYHTPQTLAAPNPEVGGNQNVFGSSLKNNFKQEKGDSLGLNETERESYPAQHIQLISDQKKNERIQEKNISQRRKGGINCNKGQEESITSIYIPHHLIAASQNSGKKSGSEKMHPRKPVSQTQERYYTSRKEEKYSELVITPHVNLNHKEEENNPIQVNYLPQKTKEETTVLDASTEDRGNLTGIGRHTTGDSGVPESLEDRDLEYLHSKSQRPPRISKSVNEAGNIQETQMDSDFILPSQYISPPSPPSLALSINRVQVPNTVIPTEGSELNRQVHHIKMERKDLEKMRLELMKKVKGLLEQNKLRQYQVRDSWKKKYFEVKKTTVPMEEVLNKLQGDLELHYQKLLIQLEARDIRKKQNNLTHTTNSKNNTIIKITSLQHEIDQLRRRLDNTKMKLVIEIKMRKQATSDLRALKAELAHKKAQSSIKHQSQK